MSLKSHSTLLCRLVVCLFIRSVFIKIESTDIILTNRRSKDRNFYSNVYAFGSSKANYNFIFGLTVVTANRPKTAIAFCRCCHKFVVVGLCVLFGFLSSFHFRSLSVSLFFSVRLSHNLCCFPFFFMAIDLSKLALDSAIIHIHIHSCTRLS